MSQAEELYRMTLEFLAAALPASRRDWLAMLPADPPIRAVAPAGLPVLERLPDAQRCAGPGTQDLTDAFADAASDLPWGQNYDDDDFVAGFQARYGFMELLGPRGPLTADEIALGLLMFAPETEYSQHRHEAEELYIILAGHAEWRAGEEPYRTEPPGAVLHRPSWIPHATRMNAEPMLALYLWRGGDLMQISEVD